MDRFRERVIATAARVEERTGVDPLDLAASIAVAADSRRELLPQSVGIGAGVMAAAVAVVCVGLLQNPAASPGPVATSAIVLVDIALALAAVACVLVSRAARSRRPVNARYEDAWARFAVETWPAPRYQPVGDLGGSAAGYSRTEFLMALSNGAPLGRFARHAPVTRMA